jgi:hypothetical protein
MPFIPKAVCNCGGFFEPDKNGAIVETLVNGKPYYKIHSDRLKCKKCGIIIYTGFAKRPITEHYKSDYNDDMNKEEISIELN